MTRLLIVEDNRKTQTMLLEAIAWREHGIDVVGAVDNGEEALACIEADPPDLVLSDIMMPLVDGLQLTEQLSRRHPEIKVVLISAHDEFEYARRAMKLGVTEYVLKPIVPDKLLESVLGAIREQQRDRKLREQIQRSLPFLREQWAARLAEGTIDPNLLDEEMSFLQIDSARPAYTCLLFSIDDLPNLLRTVRHADLQYLLVKLADEIRRMMRDFDYWSFIDRDRRIALIVGHDPERSPNHRSELLQAAEAAQRHISSRHGMTMSVGAGMGVGGLTDVHLSYKAAQEAVHYTFLIGPDQLIDIEEVDPFVPVATVHYPLELETNLINSVKLGLWEETRIGLGQLREFFQAYRSGEEQVKTLLVSILLKISQIIKETNTDSDRVLASGSELYEMMKAMRTLAEIFDWLETMFEQLCRYTQRSRSNKYKVVVQKAVEIVQSRFGDAELDLNSIAKEVNLSRAYLSTIFKREMQVNISDYLLHTRLNQARELLHRSDLKIYEIGEKVGFNNAYYFSACFKQHFGLSPAEYKKENNL